MSKIKELTNNEKKQFLLQYSDISGRIDELIGERKRWIDRATMMNPSYSDMPRGKGGDKIQTSIENIMRIEQQIDEEINKLCIMRTKIDAAVSSLQDYRLGRIIALRYIGERGYDGKLHILKLEDIGDKLGYSFDWVRHLHTVAIDKLKF